MQVAGGETARRTCRTNPPADTHTFPARHRRRQARLSLLAAVAAISATTAFPAGAQTTSAEVLNTDQAASLNSAGVTEMVPRDGRLAGYGFEVTVTGVTFTGHAGPLSQPVQAAPSDELAVVSVTEGDPDHMIQTSLLAYDTNTPATYSMQVGQQTVSLPPFPFGSASAVWAVAIPRGSPATFVASRGNFSQGFDLRRGARTSPSPLALYRDPTKPFVTEALGATTQLTGTGSTADPVTVRVAPTSAELEYFKPNPDTLQPVPPPDQAWLVVDMDNGDTQNVPQDAAGHLIDFTGTIGGNSVVLQTPAGPIESVSIGQPTSAGSLFPDYYAFPVPATFTTGSLVIKAEGAIPAEDYNTGNPYNGTPVTLTFNQTPSIAINLPPVPPATAPGYVTSAPPKTATNQRSAARAHKTSGSFPIWVVILVAVVALLGFTSVPLVRRLRRTLRVLPVGRAPRALLAGTTVALPGATAHPPVYEPLALPPGVEDHDAGADLLVEEAPPEAPAGAEPATAAAAVAAPGKDDVALVLSVLGRFQAHGLRHPISKPDVIRVLAALAIEEPPVTVEQLRDLCAIKVDRPQAAETIHSLISILRRSLPEGMLPNIRAGEAGYRWVGNVDVDWSVFRLLAGRAGGVEGADKVELGLKALSLVRGRPLEHGVWDGIRRHVARIETEIEKLAADTARTALQLRDARSAEAAIVKGMLALPESLVLWDSRYVAAASGSGFGLERARSEAKKILGDDAEQLEPLYRRLKDGDW